MGCRAEGGGPLECVPVPFSLGSPSGHSAGSAGPRRVCGVDFSWPHRLPGSQVLLVHPWASFNTLSSVWRETVRGGERREGEEPVPLFGLGVPSL